MHGRQTTRVPVARTEPSRALTAAAGRRPRRRAALLVVLFVNPRHAPPATAQFDSSAVEDVLERQAGGRRADAASPTRSAATDRSSCATSATTSTRAGSPTTPRSTAAPSRRWPATPTVLVGRCTGETSRSPARASQYEIEVTSTAASSSTSSATRPRRSRSRVGRCSLTRGDAAPDRRAGSVQKWRGDSGSGPMKVPIGQPKGSDGRRGGLARLSAPP